jgi:hypothetical protein
MAMPARYITMLVLLLALDAWGKVAVDLSEYKTDCAVKIRQEKEGLVAKWNTRQGEAAMTFSLEAGSPLFAKMEMAGKALASKIDPQFVVTTGSRKGQPGNRYIFFDNPATRASERHVGKLELAGVKVKSNGDRVTLTFSGLSAGPFSGALLVHLYDASPLVQVEASMAIDKPDVAYVYDSLLVGEFKTIAWKDLSDQFVRQPAAGEMKAVAVRLRTIMAEQEGGTIAVFPPPHSWFFPRDYTNNLKFAQVGAAGFGLRQDAKGGGAFVPWFDAPAGKTQRMDFFVMLSPDGAEKTLAGVAEYTHNDSFKPLPGHLTFTSHYHSRLTVAEMAGKKDVTPEFVAVMKGMGVNIVHLSEFHGDGNPDDPGPRRLPQMKAMFELCRKYSDQKLVLIPGEEGNKYLGKPAPREHPGHWSYLFPRPVYLTFVRAAGVPFVEEVGGYGRVYHVGSTNDMVKLLEEEKGLAWTAHPRIKASYKTPDAFKEEPWYKSDIWLGAAWKAMPGDLSEDRLGRRCLDLLDDMQQWGQRKYLPAEVDVFEIDRTHELYGHMNINYLKMEKVPKWDDWSEVLDVIRRGEFWCTTGEVLIHQFMVTRNGVEAVVEGTFPLDFAEVIWGTDKGVHRERIELRRAEFANGVRVSSKTDLSEASWMRLEVWDVARNGAYTQPVTPN